MSTTITKQKTPSSVPIMSRISPDLNNKVEELIKSGGYRNKSVFIEEAIRFFVEFRAAQAENPELVHGLSPQAN